MILLRKSVDINELMRWRKEVVNAVFSSPPDVELLQSNHDYYRRHIDDGTHIAIIASVDGADVGCGAICLGEELPSPDNTSGRCAYLMNIYVRPQFRNEGLATLIVRKLIAEAKALKCGKIYLESTPFAAQLYRRIGFADMEGMMKFVQANISANNK